jgi:hypothetical protein
MSALVCALVGSTFVSFLAGPTIGGLTFDELSSVALAMVKDCLNYELSVVYSELPVAHAVKEGGPETPGWCTLLRLS